MVSEQELRQKRVLVGILSAGCLLGAVGLLLTTESRGLASALLRVGLLLGAFWLALPTKQRPAAWARVSPWSIGLLIVLALVLPRLKYFLPVLLFGMALGWFVRPRQRK